MEIKITLGEISDKGNWEKFCESKWYGYYCMQEFWCSDDEVTLTFEEAKEFGLIKDILY